jgi:hypothetical protein
MKPKLERLRRELEALDNENGMLTKTVTESMAFIQCANALLIKNAQARIDTAARIEAIEKKKERKHAKAFCIVPRCLGRAD